MGNLLQDLKMYFKHTPKEFIEKDMKDLDKYNETGPDMLDILPDQNVKTDGCSIDDILELKYNISELESFITRIKNNYANYYVIVRIPDIFIPEAVELAEMKLEALKSELSKYTITKE